MPITPAATHVVSQWAHDSPLIACRFDPLGRFVYSTAEDNSLQRWNLTDGAKTLLKAHDSWAFALACTRDGETLVSGGGDGRLIWWPATAAEPQPVHQVDGHAGWIRALAESPDGRLFASAGNDHKVRLWDFAERKLIREFSGHDSHVYSVAWHPNGTILVSGDLKGMVHQWDVATGQLMRSFDAKALWSFNGGQGVDFGGVRGLAISPDGKSLAAGGLNNASNPLGAVHDPVVLLFEWESQKVVQTHIAEGLKGVVWRTVFHPEGWLIAAIGGSSGGFLSFWKPEIAKEAQRIALPGNTVRDFDLAGDLLRVASTHYDRHIRISRMEPKPA